jgi:murein DD-endopeptidase MepM/ murein hydrolase activator NlpD
VALDALPPGTLPLAAPVLQAEASTLQRSWRAFAVSDQPIESELTAILLEHLHKAEGAGVTYATTLLERLREGGDVSLAHRVAERLGAILARGVEQASDYVAEQATALVTNVSGMLGLALDAVLVPIYAFFLTLAMPGIRRVVKRYLPAASREHSVRLLHEIEQVLNGVATSVERQRASVRDAERRLVEVEGDAARLQEAFADRIARLYMQGPELTVELLLSSGDADEAIARTVLLERLTEGDQVDLERLEAAGVGVAAARERLAAEQLLLEDRLAEQLVVREEAESLRSSRALAAADARARTERLVDQEDDLEAEEERLEALIRAQQEQERRRRVEDERRASAAANPPRSGSSGGAVSSGGYAWPMCAPVTSEYGPRWGRVHRGIDQGAAGGTPIGAAKAGRVIFAGWQGGYGNLVLIDHGGAVSAYAHQSRFAVGQGAQVSRGQTIGYVGSTGNSTGPHLHLEIRVNGSAVNPRQYLNGSPC